MYEVKQSSVDAIAAQGLRTEDIYEAGLTFTLFEAKKSSEIEEGKYP